MEKSVATVLTEKIFGNGISLTNGKHKETTNGVEHHPQKNGVTNGHHKISKSGLNGVENLKKKTVENSKNLENLDGAIAIVGMSCRFPGANDSEEFWDLLINGRNPIGPFPANRPPPLNDDQKNFEAGFLKCAVDEFDAKFFGMSPREAPFVDPQQRILLEVVWESLENAAMNPEELRGSDTGVFVGIWNDEYKSWFPELGLDAGDHHRIYLGNAFSATAGRISHFLGLHGPNYCSESGCSSSAGALHLACQALRNGDSKIAIAAGVNLVLRCINPIGGGKLLEGPVFAQDFKCKSFDERADGYVRAEGCGSVVLRPLADAIRGGDNIHGIIRGIALNHNGASSFGSPNAIAMEMAAREALREAKVEPRDISFVEAHGTGTAVGDPAEIDAFEKVYSADRRETLFVSSVKTNMGHSESCAGLAGLIKVLLCFKHKQVPPHLHFQNLNPRINLDKIPACIPLKPTAWAQENRIAAINSCGMSGTNVHMIVQEPPPIKTLKKHHIAKLPQMIGISAKSEEALDALCAKYVSHFEQDPKLSLSDIAFTLNTGRANLSHRIGLVAKDTQDFMIKLTQKMYVKGKNSTQKPKVIFLFTGQGSQYFRMAKNVYENSTIFKLALDQCETLFKKHVTISLKKVLWEDAALLDKTEYCQPAIFSVQYALVQLWNSFGIVPDMVLGHSVGEFCASVCAGVMSLEDGMKLVVARSRLVNSLDGGKMLVLKTSPENLKNLLQEFGESDLHFCLDVAAENSDEEVVVSGSFENVQKFGNFCESKGLKTKMLKASHAFHSRQMDPIAREFGQVASKIKPQSFKCRYISGTLAREIKFSDELDAKYWVRHLRDTVRFRDASIKIGQILEESKIFVEIGSQPILSALTMANIPNCAKDTFCASLRRSEDDLSSILNSLSKMFVAGMQISWKKWFGQNLANKKLILPTYPFQRQKFWFQREDFDAAESSHRLEIHPTLGRSLPTPFSEHVFTQILSTRNLKFVADHRVAEKIIFPGTAYLETIMAAGCHVLQAGKIQVPVSIQNFAIDAPLELEKSCQIQTIVKPIGTDEVKFEIAIHKQSREDTQKWKRHATAAFVPSHMRHMQVSHSAPIDVEEIKKNSKFVECTTKAYDALGKSGFQFGPKCRTICRAWFTENGLLAEIKMPKDSNLFICHPVVLNAMVETFVLHPALDLTEDVLLPLEFAVGIRKFILHSQNFTSEVYAYGAWENRDVNVTLLNSKNEILATMEGVEYIQSCASKFLSSLNQENRDELPLLYETWRPTNHSSPGTDSTNHSTSCKEPTNQQLTSSVMTCANPSRSTLLVLGDDSQLESNLTSKLLWRGRNVIKDYAHDQSRNLEGVIFMSTVIPSSLDENQEKCKQFVKLCQKLILTYENENSKPTIVLVTRGVQYLEDEGPGNPNAATISTFVRSFANEHKDFKVKVIDLDQSEVNFDSEAEAALKIIWSEDSEMFTAVRQNQIFVQRLTFAEKMKQPLPFPNSNRFQVLTPTTKNLNDLEISVAPKVDPIEDEVEVAVKATGINSEDLFFIQSEFSESTNQEPGLEVAGIVSDVGPTCTKFKIGDEVFGIVEGSGLASHVTVSSKFLMRKPDHMTFTSAASAPVAFLTSFYGLQELANLKPGEQVLIHKAVGGVGLAAIQIAKNVGAEIFATAGSRRKRAYLRSIGIKHVYHSRNTDFGNEILKDTNGAGVDVILNSLTGPHFKEASLKACAQNGRFVEIGKMNIWTEEEVRSMRPDVKYFVVELAETSRNEPEKLNELAGTVEAEFEKGSYQGLPHEAFPLDMIREAFFYFQEAKHIGKIVINIPEAKVSPAGKIEFKNNLFHSQSTYLITGGLGGLGLQVAKWMSQSGARNLVLLGRSKPSTEVQEILNVMAASGCRTVALQGNVAIYEEMETCLKSLETLNFPPLRGIMHAAGVLASGVVQNLTWEKFETVFRPKVQGTLNLHKLTLGCDLEFFLMFSSIAAIFGSPGIANYSAANGFLDSFMNYRHAMGLPATSINFGPWAEAGMAVTDFKDGDSGIFHFPPAQGISAIENILRTGIKRSTVLKVSDWSTVKHNFRLGNYLDEIQSTTKVEPLNSDWHVSVLEEIQTCSTLAEKQTKIQNFLMKTLKETLRVAEKEQLDPDQNIFELGVDSLIAIELRNRLQATFQKMQLTVSALQYSSVQRLAAYLVGLMQLEKQNQGQP